MSRTYRRLGELLVARSAISQLQLSIALADQRVSNRRLGEIVIDRGYTNETEVAACLAYQGGFPVLDVTNVTPQPNALSRLTAEDAVSLRALPIEETPEGLVCAIADPIDVFSNDRLALLTRCHLVIKVAPETSLIKKIRSVYHLPEETAEDLGLPERDNSPARYQDLVSRRKLSVAALFDAYDAVLDRSVSLLAHPEEHAGYEAHLSMIRAASKAPIDGLAAVHDSTSHGGFRWTAFQKLSGEDLQGILQSRGPRSIPQAAAIVSRVAETVDYLQRSGGSGAWIWPGNVLIRASGPLLTPLEVPPANYVVPGVLGDAEMPGPTAVFALGQLLRDCLFGVNGEGARELPGLMQEILDKCLARSPLDRYGSAIEVASALRVHDWEALLTGRHDASQNSSDEGDSTSGQSLWSRIVKPKAA